MDTLKYNGVHIESFDSLGEFISTALSNPKPASSDSSSESFTMTSSLADACTMASNGWSEIRPEVDGVFDQVEAEIADKIGNQFTVTHDVCGSNVDIGRFVTGEPEDMIQFVPVVEATMGRVIKVLINMAVSSYVEASDIQRRGVAVCALIDTIHKLNVGVEIWIEDSILGAGRKKFSTRIKLHDSSSMLDIDSIMFALAHPSMLRRLTFSIQEQSPTAKEQGASRGGGYGTPNDLVSFDLEPDVTIEKLQNGQGDIVRDPAGWVLSTVKDLGLTE